MTHTHIECPRCHKHESFYVTGKVSLANEPSFADSGWGYASTIECLVCSYAALLSTFVVHTEQGPVDFDPVSLRLSEEGR